VTESPIDNAELSPHFGTIAVSGLPHEVDHGLIVEALSEHLGA